MNCMRNPLGLLVSVALGGLALYSPVALAIGLNDAVQSAIVNHPEVLQKLHEFRSLEQDANVPRADFFPTVDVSYQANRQKFDYSPASGVTPQHYTTRGWSVNVNQNLFQGLQTINQVRQLGYESQASYFGFLETTENIALQTLQAYQDVLLYRQLVQIAKDNYAIHKGILNQIAQRVQAGVGRRVDLEQAAGRLALAETNLITDNATLQDANTRFTRLTGQMPPAEMNEVPSLSAALPAESALMANAIHHSPGYLAAIATLHSAQAELNVRRGAFAPTLNLQLSKSPTESYNGYQGRTNLSSAAVIFSVNLFRGGADKARLGSAAEKLNASLDQRELACRNLRQTLGLAWDNVLKYKAQMASLLQHQLSTEKARNAYRKQFDIGQRTLLDVLDSENELFTAQRNYLAAQSQYVVAQANVLSNSGGLLAALKLKPLDESQPGKAASEEDLTSCDSHFEAPKMVDVQAIPARQLSNPAGDDGTDDNPLPGLPPSPGTDATRKPVIIQQAK